MERFRGFGTLMQPKVNHLRLPRKFTPGGFWGAESEFDVSFDLRPPNPSETRILHEAVPRVRDPDATNTTSDCHKNFHPGGFLGC